MSSQPKIRTERTWPHLGKEVQGYTQQFEIWHGTSLSILIKIQKEPMLSTMWEPCFGHEPNFGHLLKRRTQGKPKNVKFGIGHPWANWFRLMKNKFLGQCEDHLFAMKGPFLPHLRKDVQGYSQQFGIWPGTSLSILIKIQKEPMLRTIWEPSFGLNEPSFGHF